MPRVSSGIRVCSVFWRMRFLLLNLFLGVVLFSNAQTKDFFSPDSLRADMRVLASDSFKGRNTFSPEIKKAADFISAHFSRMKLRRINNGSSYLLPFIIGNPTKQQLKINNETVAPSQYHAFNPDDIPPSLSEKEIRIHSANAKTKAEFFAEVIKVISANQPALIHLTDAQSSLMEVLEDSSKAINENLQSYLIVYPSNDSIKTIDLRISPQAEAKMAYNVIGVLPGKKLPQEYIIISAHYDHIGFKRAKNAGEDTVFNGANDNASGVVAMLAMAKYFSFRNDNARTIIFTAFSGEELGLKGSEQLSSQLDPDKIKAVLNLEMLGKPDDYDHPHLLMTGTEFSNLYSIARKYGKGKKPEEDRYPEQRLNTRSDHYPFLLKGIVAHTFMYYSPFDQDYHKVTDDISTIDFSNFSNTLHNLLPVFEVLISGEETPKLRK